MAIPKCLYPKNQELNQMKDSKTNKQKTQEKIQDIFLF